MTTEHVETVIVGAGQAGLSTAYHLTRRGRECIVLESDDRVGDIWRRRFDSLRLYSPARYDGLPGRPFPLPPWEFPTGQQMGDYLEQYARELALPVRTASRVERVARDGEAYVVQAGSSTITAGNVVIASGTWQRPIVPDIAADVDPAIKQLHSAEYRNPSQIPPGPVLVVGASHSGADIALELSAAHEVHLAGRVHGEIPFRIDSRAAHVIFPMVWFAWSHVLTERTPIGRKAREEVRHHGGPLIRVKRSHLAAAGVRHTPQRVVGVRDGRPLLADDTVLDVASIVWCTGFGLDLHWVQVPLGDGDYPAQHRGVVEGAAGLYVVGLPFLRGFTSMLVGGVGRDADFVAGHIAKRGPAARLPRQSRGLAERAAS